MRPILRLLAAIVLTLTVAAPALAKEGFEARLDQAIPLTGDPGTTITVGFTLASTGGARDPMAGGTAFLRVHPLGGAPIEAIADADRDGHYTATFAMPQHGVAAVEIGLIGESCEGGACTRADMMFPVVGPEGGAVYVPVTAPGLADPAGVPRPETPVAAAAAVVAPVAPSVPLLPLLVVGALAVTGAGALILTARRPTHPA